MAERFLFFLQRHRKFQGTFNNARAYLKTALVHYELDHNPLDTMGRNRFRELKLGFDKGSNPGSNTKIAFNNSLVMNILQEWCGTTPTNFYNEATSTKGILGTAILTYITTALRAGNILRGTGDNKDALTLHIEDVITLENKKVFIINNRTKTSKSAIITHIPHNIDAIDKNRFCAATRLVNLAKWRLSKEKASKEDFLFINPISKKPFSTSVANKALQKFVKNICIDQGKDESIAKLFSLTSLRKTVSTEMEKRNCTPQVIAFKLRHATLSSQLSYICKHRTASNTFTKDLYKSIMPRS